LVKKTHSGKLRSTDKLLGKALGKIAEKNSLMPRRRFRGGFFVVAVKPVICRVIED
jgi:hypothetical protein